MNTVYVLTHKVRGPAGHGEPGIPYLALLTEGDWYSVGTPFPAFTTQEAAEKKLDEIGGRSYYTITPLTVE